MSSHSTKERKSKCNKLSNNLNINIRKKSIDLNIKNNLIYLLEHYYIYQTMLILTQQTVSFYLENEYKLLGTKSNKYQKCLPFQDF